MSTPRLGLRDGVPQDMRDRILYSPIHARPPVRWPDGARIALWVCPNVEHYEYDPQGPNLIFNRVPVPDVQQYGLRDYGNRVGFWRFLALMDELGIRPTVSLNIAVLEHYPEIAKAMVDRGWELMSHGLYNTRSITGMGEADERAFMKETNAIIVKHTCEGLKGMLGPALSTTINTPDIMAEAGLIYHADWQHDDQPTPIRTRGGERFVSVPYTYELNDGNPGCHDLGLVAQGWHDAFDQLWREGEESGRVMCLALHPFAIGQPHMIGLLRDFLIHARSRGGVWFATAREIAGHYLDHHYAEHVAHALALAGETA